MTLQTNCGSKRAHRIAIRSAFGRTIAYIEDHDGTLTLVKTVHGSKHFLRRPLAIAFDADAIRKAQDLGAVRIVVTDAETGRRYFSGMETFLRLAIAIDRGHGRQLALPLGSWDSPDETGGARVPEPRVPAQTPLFTMQEAA